MKQYVNNLGIEISHEENIKYHKEVKNVLDEHPKLIMALEMCKRDFNKLFLHKKAKEEHFLMKQSVIDIWDSYIRSVKASENAINSSPYTVCINGALNSFVVLRKIVSNHVIDFYRNVGVITDSDIKAGKILEETILTKSHMVDLEALMLNYTQSKINHDKRSIA